MFFLFLIVSVWGLAFLIAGFVVGWQMRRSPLPATRWQGLALMLGCVLLPLSCCLVPPLLHRIAHGHFPVGNLAGEVKVGMTMGEVEAMLGRPFDIYEHTDDEQWWYYYVDSLGLCYHCYHFGPDGRVTGSHH